MQAAIGGTLCVRAERPPEDFAFVMAMARQQDARFQLVLCSGHDDDGFLSTAVQIPTLESRAAELPRIVDEYAADAASTLEVPIASFTEADRAWVLAHGTTSLSEIEKATVRLIALRTSASVDKAARRLGMATVSLSRWIGRRNIPLSA